MNLIKYIRGQVCLTDACDEMHTYEPGCLQGPTVMTEWSYKARPYCSICDKRQWWWHRPHCQFLSRTWEHHWTSRASDVWWCETCGMKMPEGTSYLNLPMTGCVT